MWRQKLTTIGFGGMPPITIRPRREFEIGRISQHTEWAPIARAASAGAPSLHGRALAQHKALISRPAAQFITPPSNLQHALPRCQVSS